MPTIVSATDLTGTWKSGFGGTYYIRQIGDTVWWLGEASDVSPSWCNVAQGEIDGTTINLIWADVPKGGMTGKGELELTIVSDNELKAISNTGNFGDTSWKRVT